MAWQRPAFVELELNAEINSYYSDDRFYFDV